jgi:hypothetical protein
MEERRRRDGFKGVQGRGGGLNKRTLIKKQPNS